MSKTIKESFIKEFLPLFTYSSWVIILLKIRVISRLSLTNNIIESMSYSLQDMLVLLFFCFLVIWIKKIGKIIYFLVFLMSSINILSISKLGFPLNRSLFSQVGDLLMIQTSVTSPSYYRTLLILAVLSIGFIFLAIFSKRITQYKLIKFSSITLAVLTCLAVFTGSMIHTPTKFDKNVFITLSKQPSSIKNILNRDHFKNIKISDNSIKKKTSNTVLSNSPIVFVILETLSSRSLQGEFNKVMPVLSRLKEESLSFERHYTSWPFSSKALYSIICGQMNYPSHLIELRLLDSFPCDSWTKSLVDSGYTARAYYSGSLAYDRMGYFLKKNGFSELKDRKQLNKHNKYKETILSVDDLSMLEAFEKDIKANKLDINLFITMNSHSPFWRPDGKTVHEDNFLNSLSYQDLFLEKLIELMKKYEIYEKSLLVVTGDHGNRVNEVNQDVLSESLFRIPLLIKLPNRVKQVITHPTNHYQIGEFIMNSLNLMPSEKSEIFSKKEAFLFFETEQMHYAIISKEESLIYSGENQIRFDDLWVKDKASVCDNSLCPEKFTLFKKYFVEMADLYEK